jgi:predicted dehydrogenase
MYLNSLGKNGFDPSPASGDALRFGVIGYGYWGPNIVRNLHSLETAKVVAVCDKSAAALRRAKQMYPGVRLTSDCSELMRATDIDVIAIVTPVWTHFNFAKSALLNGKHVFVEKPFTSTTAEAEELIALAAKKNLQIMVDHTFLFTGASARR